jgi:hypothetical protein
VHDFWRRMTFIPDMMKRLRQLWHRIPHRHALVWGMVVAAAPIIIGEVLLRAIGGSFTRLLPIYSDEVAYWLQGRAWYAAQFDAGYFSLNEHTAPLAWSHYGSHGIFVAMLYGIVDVYRLDRIVVTNTVIFAICGVAAAVIARWSWREAVACLIVFSFFPYVISMMPASMQEIIHAGIAIVLAAGFWRLMDGSPVRIWLILAIMLAMLLRPTWGIRFAYSSDGVVSVGRTYSGGRRCDARYDVVDGGDSSTVSHVAEWLLCGHDQRLRCADSHVGVHTLQCGCHHPTYARRLYAATSLGRIVGGGGDGAVGDWATPAPTIDGDR